MSFIIYTKALLKRWWIFLIATIFGVVISFLVSQYILTPSYETYATIYVKQASGAYFIKDYNELYYSGQVCKDLMKDINYVLSEEELVKGMDIYQINDTGFINLIFRNKNPDISMKVANGLAESVVRNAMKLNINNEIQIVEYAKRPVHPVSPSILINVLESVVFLWILILLYIHFAVLKNINQYEDENFFGSNFGGNILNSTFTAGEEELKNVI